MRTRRERDVHATRRRRKNRFPRTLAAEKLFACDVFVESASNVIALSLCLNLYHSHEGANKSFRFQHYLSVFLYAIGFG